MPSTKWTDFFKLWWYAYGKDLIMWKDFLKLWVYSFAPDPITRKEYGPIIKGEYPDYYIQHRWKLVWPDLTARDSSRNYEIVPTIIDNTKSFGADPAYPGYYQFYNDAKHVLRRYNDKLAGKSYVGGSSLFYFISDPNTNHYLHRDGVWRVDKITYANDAEAQEILDADNKKKAEKEAEDRHAIVIWLSFCAIMGAFLLFLCFGPYNWPFNPRPAHYKQPTLDHKVQSLQEKADDLVD